MTRREERAKEVGMLSQVRSDYPYDKRSVEFGYTQGAIEQKAIDDAECVNQILIGKGSVIDYYKQGFHDAIDKACEYAEARYDLDYCGNVKDIISYLKSLKEE